MPKHDYAKIKQEILEENPDLKDKLETLLAGLQETNNKLKAEKDETEKVYKSEKEELEALRRFKEDMEKGDLEKKGEYEKLLERERSKLAQYEEAAKKEREQRHQFMIESEMMRSLSEHKGNPDFLGHHLKSKLQVIDDGGRERVVAVGDDGKPMLKDGKYVGPSSIVETLKADQKWSAAFEGTNQSGFGMPQGSRNGSNGSTQNPYIVKEGQKPDWTAISKLEATNPTMATKLRVEAGKPPLSGRNLSLTNAPVVVPEEQTPQQ